MHKTYSKTKKVGKRRGACCEGGREVRPAIEEECDALGPEALHGRYRSSVLMSSRRVESAHIHCSGDA